MDFRHLIERVSNPLRKKALEGTPSVMGSSQGKAEMWKDYVLNGDLENQPTYRKIREDYLKLKAVFPERAEKWLDQQANEYASKFVRGKTKDYEKILEVFGIQVFLDHFVDEGFKQDAYKMYILPKMINKLLIKTRGIMPNRKPKIVITNRFKNPKFKGLSIKNPGGIHLDRIIYIDENSIDDIDLWVHEFAHFVAGLIPNQTKPLLEKSYNDLLDIYWKRAKKKRQKLEADPRNEIEYKEAQKWRKKISEKLGFPQYGLTNFDEFFAVIIEHWLSDDTSKRLPDNRATYQFKNMIKSVLTRL